MPEEEQDIYWTMHVVAALVLVASDCCRPTITCKTDVSDWGRPDPDACLAYMHKYGYPKTYIEAGHGGILGINHWRQEIEHLRDDPEYVTWEPYREYLEVDGYI